MNITEIDQQRKYILLKIFFGLSLLVDIFLIILFLYLKFFDLLFVKSFMFCVFIMNFLLLEKKKYLLSLQIGVAAIVVSATIDTFFLGWKSYFSLYLIASTIIVINSMNLGLNWKKFEVTFILILFGLSFIFTNNGHSIYRVDSKLLEWVGLFNLMAVILSILFLSFLNFTESDKLKKKIEEISEIDPLTGAYNRRFFNKYLDIQIRQLESQIKYGNSREVNLGIVMIDIDDFKKVNDTYGHLVGDTVLAEVAHIIKAIIFERDIFCRYGGEEFVVLFTNTSKPGAMITIEKILRTIEKRELTINNNSKFHVTVSAGFASLDGESNIYRILDIADKRLYVAKKTGKNKVVSE
ncbi:MAG: GGDEF domain-containing protein [Anaerolineales bacterium]|nr:GGDEF domain-containing protein [Anaerolineales bacterium]